MDRDELLYYHYVLRRYVLTDDEIAFYELDNPLFLKFNDFKRRVVEEMEPFDFFTISLGENCLPKVFTLAYQLWEPRPQMPFDEMVTPISAVVSILEKDFANLKALNVSYHPQMKTIFASNIGLGLIYNHDYLNLNGPITEEIKRLNNKLDSRSINFKKFARLDNVIFFINMYGADNKKVDHISSLYNILTKNSSNPVIFINIIDPVFDRIESDFQIHAANYPYKGYVWHDPEHYFSESGLEFEKSVISAYMDLVKAHVRPLDCKVPKTRKIPDKKFLELSRERFMKRGDSGKANLCHDAANILAK